MNWRTAHYLFAASLVLNLAALAACLTEPTLAPATIRTAFSSARSERRANASAPAPASTTNSTRRPLWPTLAADDIPLLVARLKAAGFPAGVVREIVTAEVRARFEPRLRAITDVDSNTPYWKVPQNQLRYGTSLWEEYSRIQRERAALLRTLLSDSFFATEAMDAAQRRIYGNLPQAKIALVQRIEDDYAEMIGAVRNAAHGIMLAEDREKLVYLAREKRADLRTVLTAAEAADYEMRTSSITRVLATELADFRATEPEYRAIFALHQTLNDRFPYTGGLPNNSEERRALQQALEAQLRQDLGEARYADYLRVSHSDYRQLKRFAQQENLPPDSAARAFDLRYQVEKESMRIYRDATLSTDEKRAALAALAETTRAQVRSSLGAVAGKGYLSLLENQWLRALEHGAAVSFDGAPARTMPGGENAAISLGRGPKFHMLPPKTAATKTGG